MKASIENENARITIELLNIEVTLTELTELLEQAVRGLGYFPTGNLYYETKE